MAYITTIKDIEIHAFRKYYLEADGKRMIAFPNFLTKKDGRDALLITDGYELLDKIMRDGTPDYRNFGIGELRRVSVDHITHIECLDPPEAIAKLEGIVAELETVAGQ